MKKSRTRRPKPAYIFGGLEILVLQGLIGGILGALLIVKGYWRRFRAFFSSPPAEETGQAATVDKEMDSPE
mgnify:CR=1 FL=1